MKAIRDYFAEIGSKGGKKSKRKLTRAQSLAMLAAREAKKTTPTQHKNKRP